MVAGWNTLVLAAALRMLIYGGDTTETNDCTRPRPEALRFSRDLGDDSSWGTFYMTEGAQSG